MASSDSDARDPSSGHVPGADTAVGRAGSSHDFQQLFESHFDELARFAYRYVQSTEEAKDLVHDAFLRLWQQRETVDFRTSVRAYLFATVRNIAVDRIRRHRVQERWRVRVRQRASFGVLASPDDPDRKLAERDLAAAVADGVATLPPRQREVLLLRWHRQATYHQIAQTLGISPKTVGIHMTRALATLRSVLHHLRDTPSPVKPPQSDR